MTQFTPCALCDNPDNCASETRLKKGQCFRAFAGVVGEATKFSISKNFAELWRDVARYAEDFGQMLDETSALDGAEACRMLAKMYRRIAVAVDPKIQ